MKTAWAPWRMEYIKAKKGRGCIFCKRNRRPASRSPAGRHPTGRRPSGYILHRGKWNFVVMNRYPYNNGHLMVVPYRHTGRVESLGEAETSEMFRLVQDSIRALRRVMRPEGFNVGMNLGHSAGAGIVDHLHLHVVPRWEADTNFMPVLGETRFMVEHLKKTYRQLKTAWREL